MTGESMYPGFRRIPAIFFTCITLLALHSHLISQEPSPGQAIDAAELPQSPQAQFMLAAAEPQAPAGQSQATSQPAPSAAHNPLAGYISGAVLDVNGDTVPGATVVLEGPAPTDRRTVVVKDNGFFEFENLKPGATYHITISAKAFINWSSPAFVLTPGQYIYLTDIRLKIAGGQTTVTVYSSYEQIATEQVRVEEQQRVFGLIPNFFVVYDANAVPLTTKLKFKLTMKVATDPMTILGVGFLAGIDQAADYPNFVQGAKGYGQRFGATAADGFSDILIGGAILPSLLHQDPRYFYKGTGTKKFRTMYAFAHPFICKGDNGRWQPNYSSLGGDLASAVLSNAYYPSSNRGPGLTFKTFSVDCGERLVSSLLQEFVLHKFTPKAKK
ncbi:MAG: carboxypeptidase-like regulatory domain-containing protein [Terracidiphilus sp.]|jgi:hypothetical protein